MFKVNQIDIPDNQKCLNVWAVMQKNGPPNVPRIQVRISIGIIDLFAYSILKNIELLSNQWVVQSQPN